MATAIGGTQLNLFGQPAAGAQQPNASATTPGGTGLGLFGQPSQPKPSLFGQQTSATAASSQQKPLFGGNFTAGGQPQATPTGMLGQPATPAQPGLFGQPQGQQQPQAASLFGGAPAQATNTGGLFGQPTPTASQPQVGGQWAMPTGGLIAPQGQQQLQPLFQQPFVTNEEQKAQGEVMQLINIYQTAADPTCDKNRFRGCLYNKMDKGVGAANQKFIQQNIPLAIGNAPVDQHKWLNAMENNPRKNLLVPTQISSVAELKQRTLTVLKAVQDAKKRLEHAKEKFALVEKTCESDIQKGLENANERNQAIKVKLCKVFGKFERVLTEQGRVQLDKRPQEELISRQKDLMMRLQAPRTGLLNKVDQAKRTSHQALVMGEEFRGSDTFDGKIDGKDIDKQQVADADLRDILRVLKSQKEGNEILQRSLRDSATQIMVMEKEISI